ncbi:TPA: DUF1642 domain-containing protein [Listeria monocytogenes]|uniref:DUF1642 domain-containing protein n=1 Tax=Listeria monocytogenes TaxID=1639 RepID=UPI00027E87FC|nr:DUF1642 domain-containing protein [Listeria monocytogenes]CBY75875.1 putative phage-related protein [Listeria monocytogenes SLCC2540]HAC3259834.1 DUF1642 domain-containing protein [Listeria monocytogenes]HCW3270348.1 DUF1642 domain-containing protein [Listeria monocytogenes]
MRFKEGDKVEFIDQGELKQGVVTEIKASNFDISYQVKSEFMGTLWVTERDLVAPAPVLKVPQFVADWYEKNKCNLEYSIWKYIRNWDYHEEDGFFNFMNDNDNESIKTLIKMQNGYEVEKEPLYYVKFVDANNGNKCYLNVRSDGCKSLNNSVQNDIFKTQFTEAEIKAMDERYWQFAVPVKEVEA